MASAASGVSSSGLTAPDFTRGEEELNQSRTGFAPKNGLRLAAVHGAVSRLRALTSCPEAISKAFWRALPPQPGFS